MAPEHERTGVWLIGACGSVATTTVLGALAIRAGLAGTHGMVSELDEVAVADLPGLDALVFGGHDLIVEPLLKRAERLAEGGVLPTALLAPLAEELAEVDAWIRPGLCVEPDGATQAEEIERITADLIAFREAHQLARVVVIDVASTEPPVSADALASGPLADLEELDRALAAGESPLPPSSAYVLAAYRAGCPVVSFTPSPGPRLPVLAQVAERAGLPWAGSDGKTGETLMKSALAPMFATRNLPVRSWAAYNMLGGGDGATLADPNAAASKLSSKAQGLTAMLGYPVEGPLHIDYVADQGDWKTAIDHIGFSGFLGVRMSLQFTWSGCDSALAAPLILDLARLIARAAETGRLGPQSALAFFFKNPAGSDEHGLVAQWQELTAWCAELGGSR